MAKSGRRGRKVGLVLIDLDHFKATNDTLGHPVGDGVLSAMADRLKLTLAPDDTAARVGGDEFAAILDDRSSREEIERDARCIHRALCRPLTVQGHCIEASASLGVAMCPDDASDGESLIRRADHALYDAKARGRRCLVVLGERPSSAS